MSNVAIEVKERAGCLRAETKSPWEPVVGYSRAVRYGQHVAVTGTVGLEADGSFAPSVADQTRRAFAIIEAALEALGARMENVVRTRMFVTDIREWEACGRVHGEIFGEIRPCTTMVEVSRLIDDAAKIEIEADAHVP